MKISANDVRDRTFALVRKGYDPADVDVFLDDVADAFDEFEDSDGRAAGGAADEALRMTTDAATAARDQMLGDARDEIGRIQRTAETAAERLVRSAEDEAQSVLIDAKRDALTVMEQSRAEADQLVTEARTESDELEQRLVELRSVVQRTENLLKGMASGALGDVAKAATMLNSIEVYRDTGLEVQLDEAKGDFNVDVQDTDESPVAPSRDLPESVDRLLEQLKDIS